jgi:zona occludens toxin
VAQEVKRPVIDKSSRQYRDNKLIPKPDTNEPLSLESSPEPLPDLSPRQAEYNKIVANSKNYHPFHKLSLAVSGYYDDLDYGQNVRIFQFSAQQNGQHVFTISNHDLARAGYDVKILSECIVEIKYYDYQEFITCDAPRQGVKVANQPINKTTSVN